MSRTPERTVDCRSRELEKLRMPRAGAWSRIADSNIGKYLLPDQTPEVGLKFAKALA